MTHPPPVIRDARPEDMDWAMDLFRDFGSPVIVSGDRWVDLREERGRIAELDGERVAALFHRHGPEATEGFVLRVTRPRIGLGRAMMLDLIDQARLAGRSRVEFTTTNDNVAARALHDSIGFDLVRIDHGGFAKVLRMMGYDPAKTKMIGHHGQPITDIVHYEMKL